MSPMTTRVAACALVVIVSAAAPVSAQETGTDVVTRRVAVDTVVGSQDYVTNAADAPAQYIFDMFSSAEIRPHWQASFRPKLWRTRGDWHLLVDQISIAADFHRGSDWRVEAGRFPMPIGLGMTENRADLNPGMLWWHRAYYMPLPSLGADVPRVSLLSAVYPEGVSVSTSASHWDARAALVDRPPVQFWQAPAGATRGANVAAGAGVTPWQGFRVGAAVSSGQYADATADRGGLDYRTANVEGEYAVAYTKISGEWTRDRFDTAVGPQISRGWTLQAMQTISPRWFAHTRVSVIDSPEVARTAPFAATSQRFTSIDTTVGYRFSPEITIRVGHSAVRSFASTAFDQQIGVSLMWARRWY